MTDHDRPTYRVLSTRTIVLAAIALATIGVGLAVWLILAYGDGTPADRTRLDALRTAGTIVIGTGGAAALWLAARRQRTGEIALKQKDLDQLHAERVLALQERAAAATDQDAAERRINDLYAKAVEQLGSEKAPVRLGGMYALERLAQNVSDQRQVIVNVLCAYLRMPYDPAAGSPEERQVRLTAQHILADHLRLGDDPDHPEETFWPNIDVDLTGATLIDLDLSRCHLSGARFSGVRFVDDADFTSATFNAASTFDGATFGGRAGFEQATFAATARFVGIRAEHTSLFSDIRFAEGAFFDNARFTGLVTFQHTEFTGSARFDNAVFDGGVTFSGSRFNDGDTLTEHRVGRSSWRVGGAWFGGVRFSGSVNFAHASFTEANLILRSPFSGARVRVDRADFGRVWPTGYSVVVPEDPAERTISDHTGQWGRLEREGD